MVIFPIRTLYCDFYIILRNHLGGFLVSLLRGFPYLYAFQLVKQFISYIFVLSLYPYDVPLSYYFSLFKMMHMKKCTHGFCDGESNIICDSYPS